LIRSCVVFAAVAALAAGCGGDDAEEDAGAAPNDQSSSEVEEVAIGVITSSSGPAASLGLPEEEALRAFEKADIDCGGKRLRFVFENDQSDPVQAGAAARTLVQDDDVVGIIGPSITANMLSVIPIVLPSKTPIVFLTPQPYPGYNEEPYAFSPNFAPFDLQAQKSIEFFTEIGVDPGAVAFVAGDDATGQSVKDGFNAAGVTNIELAPVEGTDFTPLLRGFQGDGAEHLQIWISRGTPAGIARRQQVEIGLDVPTFLTSSVLGPDFFEAAGDAADGVFSYVTQALVPADLIADPGVSEQAAAYQEAYTAFGRNPLSDGGVTAPIAWDNAVSFCDAVRQLAEGGHEVTREGLRDVLETQEVAGSGGVIKRTPDDHAGFSPESFAAVMIEGRGVVPVTARDGRWVRSGS
jgi:branched-chain amino acid transport system substrate-binding protein